jgi:hypothetical protein
MMGLLNCDSYFLSLLLIRSDPYGEAGDAAEKGAERSGTFNKSGMREMAI